jgi:hypothetical protein
VVILLWGFWTGSIPSEKNRNEQEVFKVPGHGYAAKMSSTRMIHVPTGRFLPTHPPPSATVTLSSICYAVLTIYYILKMSIGIPPLSSLFLIHKESIESR